MPEGWRWRRYGWFTRQCEPRRIQRFRCGHCRRTFSTQTFAQSYWLRRPDLPLALAQRILTCGGYRQLARECRVHATTLMRLAARLGRQALLRLWIERPRAPLNEPLVIDGFESFEWSQYFPLHLNLAVGAESHYVYAFTDSELRRKGRMTESQRWRRGVLEERLGRPAPGTLVRDVETLLRLAVPAPQQLTLWSDEHPAYPFALRRLKGWRITHHTISSRAARTPNNPLFPVNLMDLLIRHNSANHKRETIAFSKRRQGVVERLALLVLWRNFAKRFSERHGGPTPAMRLGLADRPIPLAELLGKRLFPARIGLPERWDCYYRREILTRALPQQHRHRLHYAF